MWQLFNMSCELLIGSLPVTGRLFRLRGKVQGNRHPPSLEEVQVKLSRFSPVEHCKGDFRFQEGKLRLNGIVLFTQRPQKKEELALTVDVHCIGNLDLNVNYRDDNEAKAIQTLRREGIEYVVLEDTGAEAPSAGQVVESPSSAPEAEPSTAAPAAELSPAAPVTGSSSTAPEAESSSAAPEAEQQPAIPVTGQPPATPKAGPSGIDPYELPGPPLSPPRKFFKATTGPRAAPSDSATEQPSRSVSSSRKSKAQAAASGSAAGLSRSETSPPSSAAEATMEPRMTRSRTRTLSNPQLSTGDPVARPSYAADGPKRAAARKKAPAPQYPGQASAAHKDAPSTGSGPSAPPRTAQKSAAPRDAPSTASDASARPPRAQARGTGRPNRGRASSSRRRPRMTQKQLAAQRERAINAYYKELYWEMIFQQSGDLLEEELETRRTAAQAMANASPPARPLRALPPVPSDSDID